jgi:transcriptional regulator with XRE-family HTH domain
MKVNRDMSLAFGKIVRKHRESQGVSLARLAEMTSTDQTYPSKVERNLLSPSLDIAASIAQALGIPLSKLIAEAEKSQKKP